MKINPEIWTRNGREQFVVLSMRDFQKVQELIEDAEDLRILRQARRRNANAPTYTLGEVRRHLGMARKSARGRR